MPFPRVYVDELLLNWGDRLFHDPLRHVRALHLSEWAFHRDAMHLREKLMMTLRGAPEVMVKISNKASGPQGMGVVRRHLKYISRNGCVELEDQDEYLITGRQALDALLEQWHVGGWGIPQESKRRETLNVLLSMPPGTGRQAVWDAARAFAHETFGDGRPYVFAKHDDEAHPHVHMSVHTRGPDGRRLNPRKRDLHQWREAFAQQLRAHGIDANATPKMVRGQTRRPPKQAAIWRVPHEIPVHSPVTDERTRNALWEAHIETLSAWHQIARTLANSNVPEDRAMAIGIVEFVRQMPISSLGPTNTPQAPNSLPWPANLIDREHPPPVPNLQSDRNRPPLLDIDR
ncbi:relaxase/mobilization nuclease domain-containing protein [Burkholderia arboris]|uniref:relaxase/mobilization nuclease domain-containing protein n=1 Tax=Burkholderia arboris TaxID=488730 RepID=UPI00158B6699|nr:relaxase/mobilization nuclease domain-containing protein [Burkholderia arboris]MBY8609049.1 relaxase/mobilization nuclease domain-containing protein [Burkholderia arboris]